MSRYLEIDVENDCYNTHKIESWSLFWCYYTCENNSDLTLLDVWRGRTSADRNCCCDMFIFYWHTCMMTRARTSARSLAVWQCCHHIRLFISILSRVEGENQKMHVLKFETNGTLKCSENEGAERGGGNSWLRQLPMGYRLHFLPKSYYLDCPHYTARTGSICGHSTVNWQEMALFWCVLVCDLQCR